ncbi:MAG: RNA polymerase sigma factor [Bacteroidales bacterium]|nr:RNA polymerase sigma factor [Bacteroidales bacterium]
MNTTQFQKKLVNLQKNMLNFALTLTTDHEEAEDLLQETSLRALKNQEKFVENTNFKGWVLTIMRNLFINNYRQVVRNQTVFDSAANLYNIQAESNSDFGSPEQIYNIQEINKAIKELSKDLKIPFSMYLMGFKYHEIAKKLNLPLGTVKSRIFFARHELQDRLKDMQP